MAMALSSCFLMPASKRCVLKTRFAVVLVLFLFYASRTYHLFLPERAFLHTNPLAFSCHQATVPAAYSFDVAVSCGFCRFWTSLCCVRCDVEVDLSVGVQ